MAAAGKVILGRIPCPHCGGGMDVKPDKHGAPFGYCDECRGQLRIGGSSARVAAFLRKYPAIAAAMDGGGAPSAQSVTGQAAAEKMPETAKKPVTGEFTLFDGE